MLAVGGSISYYKSDNINMSNFEEFFKNSLETWSDASLAEEARESTELMAWIRSGEEG